MRNTIGFILAGSALAIGVAAIVGYAIESAWMTTWGFGDGTIRMSIPTAVSLVLVAASVMLRGHTDNQKEPTNAGSLRPITPHRS